MTSTRMLALCFTVFGCSSAMLATPRIEDSNAPRDFLAQTKAPEPRCRPAVEVLRPDSATRPYRELASISASCSPGARSLCEQRLAANACARGADAVLLSQPTAEGSPAGASMQSQISLSGKAVRWTD